MYKFIGFLVLAILLFFIGYPLINKILDGSFSKVIDWDWKQSLTSVVTSLVLVNLGPVTAGIFSEGLSD